MYNSDIQNIMKTEKYFLYRNVKLDFVFEPNLNYVDKYKY